MKSYATREYLAQLSSKGLIPKVEPDMLHVGLLYPVFGGPALGLVASGVLS